MYDKISEVLVHFLELLYLEQIANFTSEQQEIQK